MSEKGDDVEKAAELGPATRPAAAKVSIPGVVIVPLWITLSIILILYNKFILTNLEFPYPIFLTTSHLIFASITTRVLKETTSLLDDADNVQLTRAEWIRTILPIGALFSGSLVLSNYAYLTLSVSFIQMLKAFMPVAVLAVSLVFGIQKFDRKVAATVLLISSGTAIAAYGEIQFAMSGFICQWAAIAFESCRVVLIQILLQGMKMNPLVSLHFYAPVCAAINLCLLPFVEGINPFFAFRNIGLLVMFSNALLAFLLNVVMVYLIGSCSGLILCLAGIVKDILIIGGSLIIFGSAISPLQMLGYTLSLAGLVLFKVLGTK